MIKRQYTLYLENRPGILANVTGMLASKDVNIEGISVAESTDTALVQLVVNDAAKAKHVLDAAKVPYTAQDVCVVELPHKPGALAAFTAKLEKARININYLYSTAADDQADSCLVISADDLKKAEECAK